MASSYTKKDYEDYCDLLFKEYGSKVKKWITLNEPMGTTGKAYDEGVFAPGHCSPWVNRACRVGDSGIEPYIVAQNLLLAHSAAYHLYKSKYQHLTAEIGVTYVTHWFVPYSNATKDVDAAQRALDWMYGWFMDPITFGNYPRTMVDLLGSRLPKFTEEESRLLRKSFDFLGLNYYTAYYVKHNDDFDEFHLRYATDSHGITTGEKDGVPIGPHLGSYWQYFYPEGLRVLLEYTKETYMDPIIYITENGLSEKDNATQTLAEALRDDSRIDFYNSHLTSVLTAMKEKQVNVKGYFAWSYADNFEWNEGYTVSWVKLIGKCKGKGRGNGGRDKLIREGEGKGRCPENVVYECGCLQILNLMASSYTKKDYEDYCDLLFKEYGSKVKKWITLNEPMGTTGKAYDEGVFAPGHCSPWVNRACRVGDSGIEPYIVAHNLLLAHSAAYHLYKSKYQHLTAEIGVTYVTHWFVPYSNATKDVDAAQRALDWMYGWFMDPITFGNYPRTMVDLLGSRLPKFTEEESRLLRKSFDFLGLNYYTAYYVKHNDDFDEFHLRYATDSHGITTGEKDGVPIGPHLGSYWQYFYPEGLRVLLEYTKETYMDPIIYITENGLSEKDNATQTLAEALRDDSRIDFYNSHLTSVLTAMKEKQVNVKGYFAWSYADNFEWNEGYTVSWVKLIGKCKGKGRGNGGRDKLIREGEGKALEAEYGGFLSRNIVKDYEDYCDLLFKEYGSKVKKWITLNEPMGTTRKAYDEGVFAPGHCSPWVNRACRVGDSGIEPYIVAHNLLLAHSAAYHLYKSKYQHLTAEIGVTYVTHWFVPYSNATKDVDAAQRALDWMYGWFMDPITFGNYPRTMVDLLGSRLPKFTEEESRLLRKSFDFLGLNYYTAYYVKHNDDFDEFHLRYATDSHGITTGEKDGVPIGPHLGSYWQYFYPEGLRVLLEYTKETYMDPIIYITENGLSEKDNATQTLAEALRDDSRIDFYNSHLTSVLTAMKEKQVNVKGYFAWSYADNFEWNEGYTVSWVKLIGKCKGKGRGNGGRDKLIREGEGKALEAEYGGFLSRNIVKDYEDYCDLLFKEYGSKVKKWITLNEPMGTTGKAYDEGVFAPGHCSPWVNRACRVGDSGIEPYIVAHNLLLAHSAAYHLYKSKYQHLTAEIGVTYVTHWFVPYSNATKDVDAAQRALDWMYGWFMDPITFGNYPRTMVDLLGSRLPKFTEEESRLLRKSFDFLGLNYYTAYYVKHNDDFDEFHLRYATDSHGITTGEKDGVPIGPHLGSYWQYFYPEGLRVLLEYTKETYMDPIIYITENGLSEKDNATQTLAEALRDDSRIDFYNSHLTSVLTAMKEKQVNVKGYFAWSYADNFEWNEGYTVSWVKLIGKCKGKGRGNGGRDKLIREGEGKALEAEYGGFLSRNIVKDYEDYCDLLFKEYGSKVKKWITLNEPMGTTGKAYDEGVFAPGHCSPWVNRACRVGDSGIEPYIVAHNLLLAHSAAYHLYKSKYQHLTAEIGVTYVTHWFVPYSNATKDVDAAQRALDWMYGWFMDPITFGNYPRTMVDLFGSRLPKFTEEESRLLRKSFDFLGLNYYTAYYVKHNDDFDEFHLRYATDSHGITTEEESISHLLVQCNISSGLALCCRPCCKMFSGGLWCGEKDGVPIGPHLGSYWQYFYPEGLRVLLEYTKETYMDPIIYITENGKQ
ncbi:Beta-glucosidase 12, partial [Linum perenne]